MEPWSKLDGFIDESVSDLAMRTRIKNLLLQSHAIATRRWSDRFVRERPYERPFIFVRREDHIYEPDNGQLAREPGVFDHTEIAMDALYDFMQGTATVPPGVRGSRGGDPNYRLGAGTQARQVMSAFLESYIAGPAPPS
jgi:hypothetical protein